LSAPSPRAGCRIATTIAICCSGITACGLSLLFLPFTDFSFYGLSLFAMFYGLDWIATVPPTVRLTAQRFGPERANLVFGWIFAGHQLGAATAAFGAGLSRTVWATYLPAFFAAGALCIIAALITLMISRPQNAVLKPLRHKLWSRTHNTVILRSRAFARRLEGWRVRCLGHPSRRAQARAPQDDASLRPTA
jgi:MFS family permease